MDVRKAVVTGLYVAGFAAFGAGCSAVEHHEYNGPAVTIEPDVDVYNKMMGVGDRCGEIATRVVVTPTGETYGKRDTGGTWGNRFEFKATDLPLKPDNTCGSGTLYIYRGDTQESPAN